MVVLLHRGSSRMMKTIECEEPRLIACLEASEKRQLLNLRTEDLVSWTPVFDHWIAELGG